MVVEGSWGTEGHKGVLGAEESPPAGEATAVVMVGAVMTELGSLTPTRWSAVDWFVGGRTVGGWYVPCGLHLVSLIILLLKEIPLSLQLISWCIGLILIGLPSCNCEAPEGVS